MKFETGSIDSLHKQGSQVFVYKSQVNKKKNPQHRITSSHTLKWLQQV